MELTQCINYLLTQAQGTVHNLFKSRLSVYDVTPVQYMILKCLWAEDGLSPSQLALKCNLDASTITGILGRMEKKELLERRHSMDDRRGVDVYLMKDGAALKPQIEKIIDECNAEVMARFSKKEAEEIKAALSKLASYEDA